MPPCVQAAFRRLVASTAPVLAQRITVRSLQERYVDVAAPSRRGARAVYEKGTDAWAAAGIERLMNRMFSMRVGVDEATVWAAAGGEVVNATPRAAAEAAAAAAKPPAAKELLVRLQYQVVLTDCPPDAVVAITEAVMTEQCLKKEYTAKLFAYLERRPPGAPSEEEEYTDDALLTLRTAFVTTGHQAGVHAVTEIIKARRDRGAVLPREAVKAAGGLPADAARLVRRGLAYEKGDSVAQAFVAHFPAGRRPDAALWAVFAEHVASYGVASYDTAALRRLRSHSRRLPAVPDRALVREVEQQLRRRGEG